MTETARGESRGWIAAAETGDAAVLLDRPWPDASAHQRRAAEALRAALGPHLPAGRKGPLLAARIGRTLLLAEGDRSALTGLADPG